MATQAQTMPEVEQQIKAYLDGISYWRFEYSAEDTSFGYEVSSEDSVRIINDKLYGYIKNEVAKVPGILKKAPSLPENSDMKITSSPDKKISIYSWDTQTGGTWHFYNSVAIFNAGNGSVKADTINYVNTADEPPSNGGTCLDIWSIQTKTQTVYLAVILERYTSSDYAKSVTAFSIENGELNQINVFEKDGQAISLLSYEYDYMSNYDFEKMKEVNNIHLSKNGKKLYIPDVVDNQMTGQWQIYNFDGSKFVYDKTGK